jgi:hypothetical protein
MVSYKDFKTAARSNTLNVFAPVFWKRMAFEYECEVRLAGYFFPVGVFDKPPGVPPSPLVPCDLDALVTKIVISPYAPDGYLEEILAAVQLHAPALESRTSDSELDTAPLF